MEHYDGDVCSEHALGSTEGNYLRHIIFMIQGAGGTPLPTQIFHMEHYDGDLGSEHALGSTKGNYRGQNK